MDATPAPRPRLEGRLAPYTSAWRGAVRNSSRARRSLPPGTAERLRGRTRRRPTLARRGEGAGRPIGAAAGGSSLARSAPAPVRSALLGGDRSGARAAAELAAAIEHRVVPARFIGGGRVARAPAERCSLSLRVDLAATWPSNELVHRGRSKACARGSRARTSLVGVGDLLRGWGVSRTGLRATRRTPPTIDGRASPRAAEAAKCLASDENAGRGQDDRRARGRGADTLRRGMRSAALCSSALPARADASRRARFGPTRPRPSAPSRRLRTRA